MSEFGTCKLCDQQKNLLKSHIIPKGIYKRVARATGKIHTATVSVAPDAGTSHLTSLQLKEKLLCRECEDTLKNYGEDCFFALVDSGLARLYDAARQADKNVIGGDELAPLLDATNLSKFALSIVWRCHVSSLEPLRKYNGSLGNAFSGDIRSYLLGQAEFPRKTVILATVYDEGPMQCSFHLPLKLRVTDQGNSYWAHRFYCLGLKFEICRGGYDLFMDSMVSSETHVPLALSCERFERSELQRSMIRSVYSTKSVGVLGKD